MNVPPNDGPPVGLSELIRGRAPTMIIPATVEPATVLTMSVAGPRGAVSEAVNLTITLESLPLALLIVRPGVDVVTLLPKRPEPVMRRVKIES